MTPNNLLNNEIHVWMIPLDVTEDKFESLKEILSFDEKFRLEKFRFKKDRKQYAVSHGILRILLAKYLDRKPNQIAFSKNQFGKPKVYGEPIKFNLSHSSNFALVAISREVDVGVDVETITNEIDHLDIAKRYFNRSEYLEILSAQQANQKRIFYKFWTGKEAVIKAIGEGLNIPLSSFSITSNSESTQTISFLSSENEDSIWTLKQLNLGSKVLEGSLAHRGLEKSIIYFNWDDP